MKKMTTMILAMLFLVPALAMAKPALGKKFQAAYPKSKLTGCAICHTDADYALNPYGLDWEKASFDFKAIEQLDSDADGAVNLAEIEAGTMPGLANSNPQHEIMMKELQNLSNEQLEVIMEWMNSL